MRRLLAQAMAQLVCLYCCVLNLPAFACCGLNLPGVPEGCPREGDHRDPDSLEEPSPCSRPGVHSGIWCQCAAHLPWRLATGQSCRPPRAQHPFQYEVRFMKSCHGTSEAVLLGDNLLATKQQLLTSLGAETIPVRTCSPPGLFGVPATMKAAPCTDTPLATCLQAANLV